MKTVPKKLTRCAIYTRKSTEHNLDLEFNSLDAQREACEAYIKSQAHEGWRLVSDRYDDGGLSGASLDRRALQVLLEDIRAGKIDTVVVYKVDRITRSLTDFAKLVELFEQHGVSFVSVTQSFSTANSMGRLTLNVLLSFAQFEREVIGERVRDKVAASKKKGLWVGGPVPLGYRTQDKKLVVVPEEAETVRIIFGRYLELGSMGALVRDLDERGIRTKRRAGPNGTRGGIRFGVGPLAHLLKNRFYIGEVVYRGEVHEGEHKPIVGRDLFEAVQDKLKANAIERKARLRSSPAILTGLIFDDRGNRMSPSHTTKLGVRYRYYVSHALLQRRPDEAGRVSRVPAAEIEARVIEAVRRRLTHGDDPQQRIDPHDRDLVEQQVDHIVVRPDAIEIKLRTPEATTMKDVDGGPCEGLLASLSIDVPWAPETFRAVKGILHAPADRQTIQPRARDLLLSAIAKARGWIDDLIAGRVGSFAEIAIREGKVERHIRLLAPLAFTSPRIVTAIVEATAPSDLTVTGLAKAVPFTWAEQEQQVGIIQY
jgi:DNA invertase Pin-like site-specific DNA recombinase